MHLLRIVVIWAFSLAAGNILIPAFDCRYPHSIQKEAVAVLETCKTIEAQPPTNNQTLQLLQETKFFRLELQHCSLIETCTIVYCGNYDHQTQLLTHSFTEVHQNISREDCRKWHLHRQYVDIFGNSHPLTINQEAIIHLG